MDEAEGGHFTAAEKKERQAEIKADYERRMALALHELEVAKAAGHRKVTAASVADFYQLDPGTLSRRRRGGRGRTNRVLGLVSTAPALLNAIGSEDPFVDIASSSTVPSTATSNRIGDQPRFYQDPGHTPTGGTRPLTFAVSPDSTVNTPKQPAGHISAATRVYERFNLPASSPPRVAVSLSRSRSYSLADVESGNAVTGEGILPFSSPPEHMVERRPIRPLPTPRLATSTPRHQGSKTLSSPRHRAHPPTEPSAGQIQQAFDYHMSDPVEEPEKDCAAVDEEEEEEEDELVDWGGGEPFSKSAEMTQMFREDLELASRAEAVKIANDRRNRRRRCRITEKDLSGFMVYLDERDVPLGTLLTALFVSESRSDMTKSLVTKWLRSPTAPVLGELAPYDQSLKRVLTELDRESAKLVNEDYFRVNTSISREEDVTEYKPTSVLGRTTSTRTMYPVLRAITGTRSQQPAPQAKVVSPEITIISETLLSEPDGTFEHLDGCIWDGEDEWSECDCPEPTSAIQPLAPATEDREPPTDINGARAGPSVTSAALGMVPNADDMAAAAAIASAGATKRRLGQRDPRVVALYASLSLLFARNRQCNRLHIIMGLYHYAARTSRKAIETLSRAGLCVSYLTIRRAAVALAEDARKRLVALLANPAKRWVLCYDNLNWMNRVKDKSALTKSTMQAAVHGNVIIVDWTAAYRKISDTVRVCSAELFQQTFGAGIRQPTGTPQSLFNLARPERAPKNASIQQSGQGPVVATSLRSRHFRNLIEDDEDDEDYGDPIQIYDGEQDTNAAVAQADHRSDPEENIEGVAMQVTDPAQYSEPPEVNNPASADAELDDMFYEELGSSPSRPRAPQAPTSQVARSAFPPATVEDVEDETVTEARERARRQTIRDESDWKRRAPLPEDAKVKTVLGDQHERDHTAEAILCHAYNAWLDLHPEYAALRSAVPEPPQILPLQPKKSNIRPLPVLDEDEATVIGNIKVIHEYLKHIGINHEDVKSQIVAIIADVYTVEKITSAQHRRRDHMDDEIERLTGVRVWPAFFHTQMALLKNILSSHHGSTSVDDIFSTRKSAQWAGNKNLNVDPIKYHDGARFILNALFPSLVDSLITPALIEAGYRVRPEAEGQPLNFEQFDKVARASVLPILIKNAETLSWTLDNDYESKPDLVYLHGATLFRECGIFVEFNHAIRSGDIGRIVVMLKQMLPLFQAGHQPRCVNAISELLISMNWESHPELVLLMLGGSIVNRDGKPDNFVPTDLHQEQDVMALKHTFPLHGMNGGITQKAMLGSVLHVFRATLRSLNQSLHIASQNNKHTMKSMTPTCNLISRRVNEAEGFSWTPGRNSAAFEIHRTKDNSKLATDQQTAGMAALIGTKADPGVLPNMKARRAVRIAKTGAAAAANSDDEEESLIPAGEDSGRRAGCADADEYIGGLEDDML